MSASDRAPDPERELREQELREQELREQELREQELLLPSRDMTLHRGVLALERLASAAEILVKEVEAWHHTGRLIREDQRIAREDEQREAFRGGRSSR